MFVNNFVDHKVSPCLSPKLHHHSWQEIWTIKVIKCPPYSSPQRDINSNPNRNLKITRTQMLTLKLQQGSLHLDLEGHLVAFIKTEHASNYVGAFLDKLSANKGLMLGKAAFSTVATLHFSNSVVTKMSLSEPLPLQHHSFFYRNYFFDIRELVKQVTFLSHWDTNQK